MIAFVVAFALAAPPPDFIRPLSDREKKRATALIEGWKVSPRGPYSGVLWFCNDGQQLEPKLNACVPFGGGRMYGVLTPQAAELGANYGLYMGTIFAALTPEMFFPNDYYRVRAYIVEAYLERALDGWALRGAKNYRGFRQVEDESEFARRCIMEVTKRHDIVTRYRGMIVRMIRAMPYGKRSMVADDIRALAAILGDADTKGFGELRFKIHAMPEPSDIDKVAAYVTTATADLAVKANELVDKMRVYYTPAHRLERLKEIKQWIHDPATKKTIDKLLATDTSSGPDLVRVGAELIATADKVIVAGSSSRQGERNLLLLHAMAMVEEMWVAVTADLTKRPLSRAQAIELTAELVRAGQSLGWFSPREKDALAAALAGMSSGEPAAYVGAVKVLSRALEWARARLLGDLGIPLERYAAVEPRARGVIDDQLRGSMMLPFAALVDRLTTDVEQIKGGGHRLVGLEGVGTGSLRGENSGLAVGTLHVQLAGESPHDLQRTDIALLFDLPPELPPVAGIITVGAAGALSHVSLLARNLGIPHATIGGEVATVLQGLAGEPLFLGVSAGGRVALGKPEALPPEERAQVEDEPRRDTKTTLRIDETRLDLATTRIAPLTEISEADIGIRVGPKAGELGRLKRLFPTRVSDAAVIPFGAFVQHVDRPGKDGSPSPLSRLKTAYQTARLLTADEAERAMLQELEVFSHSIATLPFAPGFEAEVGKALDRLGRPSTFGVFVRSDTNVEDLKDFTGAGLNLTVFNRVGGRSVQAAIREVWASPFSERSYRWRQRLLENPEHVYPSVILHRTVPSEASGVMVTTDLESGQSGALTISASQGVSAVVDGGAPETIVVDAGGNVRLLASARSATMKVIPRPPQEGIQVVATTGKDPLLGDREIGELKALAAEVQEKIPARGDDMPWDIEFGFVDHHAFLMQIRPLRISRAAATQPFLRALDAQAALPTAPVGLSQEVP
ncbi:MAG: hypothetical protein HY903_23640 [Deltaproteobacteria bacterium]|nr:hypothetical protein [Deltaproteobacteria bacterium]